MANKKKFYVIWKGRKCGIFSSWDECKSNVVGYRDAQYKSFASMKEAENAFNKSYWEVVHKKVMSFPSNGTAAGPILDSLSVDAACSGNPGLLEYRGVYTKTREEIFHAGPFECGTNNIGEFLAIVHGLALLKQQNKQIPIYSDSMNGISWVGNKKCKTKLIKNDKNAFLFELIDRAEKWLKENNYTTIINKWDTKKWGEIPADFGRK